MATVAQVERIGDHLLKWLGLVVSILLLVTLWQSYKLNRKKLEEEAP